MKKPFTLFRSFRWKITFVLVLLMCFAGALSNLLVYEYSLKSQFKQVREKLIVIAQAVALTVDPEALLKIPLNKEGANSPYYKSIEEKLLKIKVLAPSLAYIYILEKTEKYGILKFIIDIHPGGKKARLEPAFPGEAYDGLRYPELMSAFNGPTADTKLVTDEWGTFLSGYAPIRDTKGSVVAVLGIDMTAEDLHFIQKEVWKRSVFVLILGIIFSLILGMFFSQRVTAPMKKLIDGTRHISSGDLQYRVEVKGEDELGELASDFNKMAANLHKARETLVNYFYRAVQSLIRVLEARDPYTKGHSDRVAEYSAKIAAEIGLPKERIKLLKESALLHDIGKLGIQEMILNKKTTFTEEDRKTIEKHPAIGEEILKPVSIDKEMLAIVRSHHERYDGKGYPDGLAGDKIDLLAAIVAVADSYDAMTSNRPYRKNLSKEEAIDQLQENRGLQFNPLLVDSFVRVLRKG